MNDLIVKCIPQESALDNVSNIATIIISLINLLFVIYIYFKDKKNEKNEKIKSFKYDWYKMIDIRKRVENLAELNKNINIKACELKNDPEDSLDNRNVLMSNYLLEINTIIFNEKNSFTSLLKCIDEKENIEITKLYNAYQEEYMDIFLKAMSKTNFDVSKLNELSSEINKRFYNYGISLIK